MRPTFVALDLETTGLDPERDRIIEIGVVRFQSDGEIQTWSTLVNPGCPIPPRIEQLTGISNAAVSRAPTLPMVLPSLRRFVGDATLIGHNLAFDLSFLRQADFLTRNPTVDTFTLAAIVLPRQKSYALSALAEFLNVKLSTAHRALADAQAAAELFRALIRHAEMHIPFQVIQQINHLAERCRPPWPLREVFQEIERRQARHAFTRSVPAKPASPEPLWPSGESLQVREPGELPAKPLDVSALTNMLVPGGQVAVQFPAYEHRPQQVQMLAAVARAFNEGRHLLVEAGTGTGKSLAYLLPAIRFALDNQERVVISTNTINLQEQLFRKDIPDLRRILGTEVRCALLKGRSNYLCPRRFEALFQASELTIPEMNVIAQVLAWLPNTATGDQAELFLPNAEERAVWDQIASEPEGCTLERCLRKQKGRCFFYQAHQRAQSAHVLIINHALLFADIAAENRVLPEYTHLIIDEAHHIEEAATQQLTFTASNEVTDQRLSKLYTTSHRLGLLDEILHSLRQAVEPQILELFQAHVRIIQQTAQMAQAHMARFFATMLDFLRRHSRQRLDTPYDVRIPLDQGMRRQPAWLELETAWDEASRCLKTLAEQASQLAAGLGEFGQYDIPDREELILELAEAVHSLNEYRKRLEAIITSPNANEIYWAEITTRNGQLSLKAAPLHIGPLVEAHLLSPKRTVVMTSATLRTAGSFKYIRGQLNAWNAEELAVDSPFDYERQALLYLPTDVPEPDQPGYQEAVERAIIELARAINGRLLALFTSHSQLRKTTEAVIQALMPEGFTIFSQSDGISRVQLLHGFRTTPKSVLLGTRSFWEGVDIAGEALSALVICRLPFAVPQDPIVQARSQNFADPFHEYHLPDAILRFRQGFGRLIRSRQDIGVCVILDRRVLTKPYGLLFLQSLPRCYEIRGPLTQLPAAAADWLVRQTLSQAL
ncbi:MAG: helicase C-terminal domain-containing protein [Anaerolineae bacterium]|nr:exonuclease domain-containing protein [Anaerolineae bacterium]MDW8098370.1 helicase C-terminal domain-containing protein [Anaerolineae bacterium]